MNIKLFGFIIECQPHIPGCMHCCHVNRQQGKEEQAREKREREIMRESESEPRP